MDALNLRFEVDRALTAAETAHDALERASRCAASEHLRTALAFRLADAADLKRRLSNLAQHARLAARETA